MLKSDLTARLSARFPAVPASDIRLIVDAILDRMTSTLTAGNRIEIRGFGAFTVRYRPLRIGRNPLSGKTLEVPGKYVPAFRPGKELRERVDS